MRNPFVRRPGVVIPTGTADQSSTSPHPGFERVDTVGSKASSILSIRSNKSHDVGEYKMSGEYEPRHDVLRPSNSQRSHRIGLLPSHRMMANADLISLFLVVNDSGVYLPVSVYFPALTRLSGL